ncbi:WbqC-like protein family protein [Fodinibius roseus]|uniref:WbqC-like protein family protein n=1 Tax=Fodinibius roseus TaxID=1194090 RepID=A0A1M5GLI2_9BACT|nr:WbqC family protein [Fodinibius roseus]SHG04594.1 WbqC-like protein family protein [Fodinibius roseus]
MNSLTVMQPYFFPYIGYFQLIKVVDKFVFYDDVNFIKNGWINRNRILINGHPKYFTVPCKDVSSYKKIKDIEHGLNQRVRKKLLKKIKFTYSNAPYFDEVYEVVKQVLALRTDYINELAMQSVKKSSEYLGITCSFLKSSQEFENQEYDTVDRLIDICRQEEVDNLINPIGGKKLYQKEYFQERGINLHFLKAEKQEYKQFGEDFIPWLSILDVMMFNAPARIKDGLLGRYTLQ